MSSFYLALFYPLFRAREEDMRRKRVTEAYSLMGDILSSKPVIQPIPSRYSSTRPLSPRAAAQERALREKEKKNRRTQKTGAGGQHSSPYLSSSRSLNLSSPHGGGSRSVNPAIAVTSAANTESLKPAKKVQFSPYAMSMWYKNDS